MADFKYIKFFDTIDNTQVNLVGGKNASLGEMYQKLTKQGIKVPNGFAITSKAYWDFLTENKLLEELRTKLEELDTTTFTNLREIGEICRGMLLKAQVPEAIQTEIKEAYKLLQNESVAVRSSATAEDLPNASFAGQQESFLNISGTENLLKAIQKCFASLFTDRAIKYRHDN